jgi:cytochrome c-type biogenesis protein CcmH/NrfF
MLPIAHAGHWLLWILYAAPVVIVLASIVIAVVRDRRETGPEPESDRH